jgi:hypothetical protein
MIAPELHPKTLCAPVASSTAARSSTSVSTVWPSRCGPLMPRPAAVGDVDGEGVGQRFGELDVVVRRRHRAVP